MADIFWPAGVPDEPLLEGLEWSPLDTGVADDTESGDVMTGPGGLGQVILLGASYPMSNNQYRGLWLPWWMARMRDGGCDNGVHAFWLREPYSRVPIQWIRQPQQKIVPQRDGLGWIVRLPLRSLPLASLPT